MKTGKTTATIASDRQAKVYAACKKCSPGVSFTFYRAIKEALKCEGFEAEIELHKLLKIGKLKRFNPDSQTVPIYEFVNLKK